MATPSTPHREREVALVVGGSSTFKIFAPKRLSGPGLAAEGEGRRSKLSATESNELARLRASLDDLVDYIARMSGARLEVVFDSPPRDPAEPAILIGELAQQRFGPPGPHVIGNQRFRVVVGASGIGLYGESDLSTSYAIYEVLERLGCRWFMPGELGEEIPHSNHLALTERDDVLAPATIYRNLWYGDDAFKRRNRLGGVLVAAGHRLERWISAAQREAHPEWRAIVNGQPHPSRLRWSSPEVAGALVEAIDASLAKTSEVSASLSPGDGLGFDETVDRALDAGDWDPTMNSVSLTDRLLVLANRVAEGLAPRHPDLTLGLLAYVSYTRPPVRERVHPSIVPVIAPITYCRSHPLSDDRCPGTSELRKTVEGWSERSSRLALRSYAYNLAEPSAPNPMLRKWSFDLPFMFAHKVQFFQPETLPNFETTLPALHLGMRLAWDSRKSPEAILQELFTRFYGHAAEQVRAYTDIIDAAWVDVGEYSGGDLSYPKRFNQATLAKARRALDAAKAACVAEKESARVAVLDASLAQLELYMKMQGNLRSGDVGELQSDVDTWLARAQALSEKYAVNSAFGKARWAGPTGIYGNYFTRFHQAAYVEAARIHATERALSAKPLCTFQLRFSDSLTLPTNESPPLLDPTAAPVDVCERTWSSLGRHDYFGGAWYQAELGPQQLPADQAAFLWLSRADGVVQIWINGAPVPVVTRDLPAPLSIEIHGKPATWNLSGKLRSDGPNRVTIAVRRTKLAELGGGGLLGPVYAYAHVR